MHGIGGKIWSIPIAFYLIYCLLVHVTADAKAVTSYAAISGGHVTHATNS